MQCTSDSNTLFYSVFMLPSVFHVLLQEIKKYSVTRSLVHLLVRVRSSNSRVQFSTGSYLIQTHWKALLHCCNQLVQLWLASYVRISENLFKSVRMFQTVTQSSFWSVTTSWSRWSLKKSNRNEKKMMHTLDISSRRIQKLQQGNDISWRTVHVSCSQPARFRSGHARHATDRLGLIKVPSYLTTEVRGPFVDKRVSAQHLHYSSSATEDTGQWGKGASMWNPSQTGLKPRIKITDCSKRHLQLGWHFLS